MKHGKGIIVYPNGDKYEGKFKNNEKDGKGIITHPEITIDKKVFFSGIKVKIIEQIEKAKSEIVIAVAWFTDTKIIETLEKAQKKGIKIQIIFNDDRINNKELFRKLLIGNADIKITSKLMHNKFCIIDNTIVINGSYNWTLNAKNNNENIHITINDINLANEFKNEFVKISKQSSCKNLIFKSDEFILNEFIEKYKFSMTSPYFYQIKDDNSYRIKNFYILIKSLDDVVYIKNYIYTVNLARNHNPTINSYGIHFKSFYSDWNGSYKNERINSFDKIEDWSIGESSIHFKNEYCTVEKNKHVFKINKNGDLIGEIDFYDNQNNNNYYNPTRNRFIDYKSHEYKLETSLFRKDSIGKRTLVISETINNKTYYGLINVELSIFIPTIYQEYNVDGDTIYFHSFPQFYLIKEKLTTLDYYKIIYSKSGNDKRTINYNIDSQKIIHNSKEDINDYDGNNPMKNIHISDASDATTIFLLKYFISYKTKINKYPFYLCLKVMQQFRSRINVEFDTIQNKEFFETIEKLIK